MPADRFIRDYFRARRYAGSKDRAAVAERVFQIYRHRASYAWRMGSEESRALVIASLLVEGTNGDDIASLFSGEGYGPAPLSDAEREAVVHAPAGDPPLSVKGEFPAFLESELRERFGDNLLTETQALTARAPIDLRVNALKASRADVIAGLCEAGYLAEATPYSPWGVRIPAGATGLERTDLFEAGAFEFQDEGSQIAVLLCDAAPGMRVLDLAAGAGGKSLALAAAMQNRGHILAFDDTPVRLKPLMGRAARAGATIVSVAETRDGPAWHSGLFDRVLVDAPCSGTGTWRRQPELRWRLSPERLEALTGVQDRLLDDGARHTAPGGRLVYVTCSLLPCENERRIAAFLDRTPGFAAISATQLWRHSAPPPPGMGEFFIASPYATQTDGFFVAILARG